MAILVSTALSPQVFTDKMPEEVAVHLNHTSWSTVVKPKKVHKPSAWPSKPVVATVLSNKKGPPPTMTSGVTHESAPPIKAEVSAMARGCVGGGLGAEYFVPAP